MFHASTRVTPGCDIGLQLQRMSHESSHFRVQRLSQHAPSSTARRANLCCSYHRTATWTPDGALRGAYLVPTAAGPTAHTIRRHVAPTGGAAVATTANTIRRHVVVGQRWPPPWPQNIRVSSQQKGGKSGQNNTGGPSNLRGRCK